MQPGNTKQRFYTVEVAIAAPQVGGPLPAGIQGRSTIVIENRCFSICSVASAINGANEIGIGGTGSLAAVSQDGQYAIQFRTDHEQYMNAPLHSIAGFGSAQLGAIFEFVAPIVLEPKTSVVVEVTNLIPRADSILVSVVFAGFETLDGPPKV